MPWAKFIKAHLGVLVGFDFFTVEVLTWCGLVCYHVLFAIDIASRKVELLGMAVNSGGAWMEQIARSLVDVFDGFLLGKRCVLTDRVVLGAGDACRMKIESELLHDQRTNGRGTRAVGARELHRRTAAQLGIGGREP